MVSTKNLHSARLCLTLLIIFSHAKGFCLEAYSDKISITDFKFYRKIYYKNQQLLIYKNPEIKSIFYLSEKNQQDFTKKDNQVLLNIKIDSTKSNYKISYLNNKLHFASKQKTTYFEAADNLKCAKSLEENYLKMGSRSILRSIQSVNVQSLTDSTCNEEQKQKLGLFLSDMLTTENAWLSKCYSNESVKKLIETDSNYLNYTGSVYSKYLRLVQKINNNEKPIQISCKINTPGKLGSFDESTNPERISFDWENLSKQANSDNKLSNNVKATLGHELFHYGEQMQNPEDINLSNCINESYAKIFTDICTETDVSRLLSKNDKVTTLKIPTSDEISKACAKRKTIEVQKVTSSDASIESKNTGQAPGATGLTAFKEQQNLAKNAAAHQKLQQTVSQSDFTQPSDSEFATLVSNTAAGTTEGSAYTVSANSSFGQTVQKTMNAFTNSGNTLTNKLNTAVAVVTNTAQAKTATLGSTGSTSTTSSTYTPTLTSNGTTTPTNIDSNASANNRMPANVQDKSGTSGKTSLGNPGKLSEMGGGNTGLSNNNFSTGSGNLGNTNAAKDGTSQSVDSGIGGGGLNGASSGGGSSTAPSTAKKSSGQKQEDGAAMVNTIKSLKAFNTVTGGQYQEIKKYYNNPQFQNLLQTYDMRIMVKNPTGQYVAIGVDSKKAKKVFNDDGQILKTVEEKK